jgi:MFS family permease
LFYGYIIVAAAFFIHLIAYGVSDSFGVFVNPWVKDPGWTRAAISGAYSLSFVLTGILGMAMGFIIDRFGPRAALSICGICLGTGFILISRMQAEWQLFLFYGLIFGAGMSGIWAPLLSLISRWFTGRRGLVTGIVVSGGGLGAFIGPPVITGLINAFRWRQTALFLGIFMLAAILPAAQFLKRDPSLVGQQPYGKIDTAGQSALSSAKEFSTREALSTTQFWIVFSLLFCLAFYTFSILIHVTPHAIGLGLPDSSAAIVLAVIGGVSIIGNYVMGRAGDRIGPRKVLLICFILMSASLFWLAQAGEQWMLYLFSVVFGFNHGANATAQAPLVARLFGLQAHGAIFGAAALGFTLGGAVGPVVTGYLFDLTGSYQPSFILCGMMGIIGLVLTLVLKPTARLPVKI